MNLDDIAHLRLHNQQISRTMASSATPTTPAEMVSWLGAMQAQDYTGAKWSLGLRLRPTTDAAIEEAFNRGDILRTHMMRPTWHFVTPGDIRWMLALTAPRVHQVNGGMYRQVGMDAAALSRSIEAITQSLAGGNQLTRDELKDRVQTAGVAVDSGLRMTYIMMNAELEGIVCSGPRRGKQFTYMLLDERAPQATTMARDEALVELARRYFRSHGPATAADFARWSGLTLADTRQALEALRSELMEETIEGQTYRFAPTPAPPRDPSPTAYLVSIYDEYTIGYKDLSAIGSSEHGETLRAMGNALQNVIILDRQIVGTWRRVIDRKALTVELNWLRPATDWERQAVAAAAELYGKFLSLPVIVE